MYPNRIHYVSYGNTLFGTIFKDNYMGDSNFEKTTVEGASFNLTAADGGVVSVSGKRTVTSTSYPIKRLNSRIWLSRDAKMDIFNIQKSICRSSKDIELFRGVLINTDREHHFSKSAQEFSVEFHVTRGTATSFIKKCVDNKLLYKITTNKYLVNPFIFTPIGAQNESIYNAQLQWREYEMENLDKSKLIEPAQKLKDEYQLTAPIALLLGNDFFMDILQQDIDGKTLTVKQIEAIQKAFIVT